MSFASGSDDYRMDFNNLLFNLFSMTAFRGNCLENLVHHFFLLLLSVLVSFFYLQGCFNGRQQIRRI